MHHSGSIAPVALAAALILAIAAAQGATPAQVGLAWLLAHDPQILLIPGTSSLEHLDDNVATADVRLDAASMAALDVLAKAGGRR